MGLLVKVPDPLGFAPRGPLPWTNLGKGVARATRFSPGAEGGVQVRGRGSGLRLAVGEPGRGSANSAAGTRHLRPPKWPKGKGVQ